MGEVLDSTRSWVLLRGVTGDAPGHALRYRRCVAAGARRRARIVNPVAALVSGMSCVS